MEAKLVDWNATGFAKKQEKRTTEYHPTLHPKAPNQNADSGSCLNVFSCVSERET